jgi:hypothetical protein
VTTLETANAPPLDAVIAALRVPPRPFAEWRGLLVAMVLVVGLTAGLQGLLALAAILVAGDLVRVAAMRLTGFEDRRMVGLPLVHAELAPGSSPWREAAVILSQPLFLAALACGLYFLARETGSSLALETSRVALGVGAFTLLPLQPLDGWRLLELSAYSRWRPLELVVSSLCALALLAAGVAQGGLFWVGLGAFVGLASWNTLRLVRGAQALEATAVPLGARTSELPEASLRALRGEVSTQFATSLATWRLRGPEAAARVEASYLRELHLRVARRPPPLALAVVVLVSWLGLAVGFGWAASRFARLTQASSDSTPLTAPSAPPAAPGRSG